MKVKFYGEEKGIGKEREKWEVEKKEKEEDGGGEKIRVRWKRR